MRLRLIAATALATLAAGCSNDSEPDRSAPASSPTASARPSPTAPQLISPEVLTHAFPAAADLPGGWSASSPAVQKPEAKPNAKPPFQTDRKSCNAALVDVFGARAARVEKETAKGGQTLLGPGQVSLSLELVGFKPGEAAGEMRSINAGFGECYDTGAIYQGAPMRIHKLDTQPTGDDFGGLQIDGVEKGRPVTYRIAFARTGDVVVALVDGTPGTSAADFGTIFAAAVTAAGAI